MMLEQQPVAVLGPSAAEYAIIARIAADHDGPLMLCEEAIEQLREALKNSADLERQRAQNHDKTAAAAAAARRAEMRNGAPHISRGKQ